MIVTKFGGTSVEDAAAISRTQGIVQSRIGHRPVVVVSALARVTDSLLQAVSLAVAGCERQSSDVVERLAERHLAVTRELLPHPDQTVASLLQLFNELRVLVRAVCVLREVTPQRSDRIVSFGERLSTVIVTAALQQAGIDAELVDARECIITDDHFTSATPIVPETNDRLRARLLPLLHGGKTPVLGGFIAATARGQSTTLGRNGSDFSAALVGAAIAAERVEIWTDVDGIRTADPVLYPQAEHLETLTFNEAAELAQLGAKVLHPAALLPTIEKNIPIQVLNSRNPQHAGTRVQAEGDGLARIKAIVVKRGITVVEASTPRSLRNHGLTSRMFSLLESHGCSPDLASIRDNSVTVTVDKKEVVPLVCEGLGAQVHVHAENSKALVSLVAEDIRSIAGLHTLVFAALRGIDVRLIAQGASNWSFSVVIEEKDVAEAVRRLHEQIIGRGLPEPSASDPSTPPAAIALPRSA